MKKVVGQRLWTVVFVLVAAAIGLVVGLTIDDAEPDTTPANDTATTIDVGFAQDMSAHHQQALAICDLLAPTARPDIRGLASQIEKTQWREIGQMQGWLQMLDAPLQGERPMSWMKVQAGHHHASSVSSMPGSANGEELTRLSSATEVQNEILFLQLMIRHHQGAVDMAAEASRAAGDPEIRRAAVAMVKSQSDEVAVMVVMLNQRGGQALPYPV
jgi:uncharacterized protein (DUF305 family)